MHFRKSLIATFAFFLFFAISFGVNAKGEQTKYLTRWDAVELILKASREFVPIDENDAFYYPDVIGTPEQTKYLKYAVKYKMLDPEPSRGLLFPYRSVTKSEFLKMMTIAFSFSENIPQAYSDVEKGAWYEPYAGLADYYNLFADSPPGGQLHPSLWVTDQMAYLALKAIYLKEPTRKPKNFNFKFEAKPEGSALTATPRLVKQAIQNLFKKQVVEPPEKTKNDVIALVNAERQKAGLPVLADNLLLRIAAQNHARDMYKRGYFSHTTPDGLDYIDRIRSANYMKIDLNECGCRTVYNVRALMDIGRTETKPHSAEGETEICGCKPHFALGENLAKGQLTAKEVMEDWMNSPGHRANILHPQFEEIGIGIFGDVWVQNFGRRKLE